MSRFSEPNSLAMEPADPSSPAERMAVILAGLTPAQAAAAMLQGAVLVLAGAGTGKTRTLTAGVASSATMTRVYCKVSGMPRWTAEVRRRSCLMRLNRQITPTDRRVRSWKKA
jgi:DNA helicase TIP49 (TBP-interacting protein)